MSKKTRTIIEIPHDYGSGVITKIMQVLKEADIDVARVDGATAYTGAHIQEAFESGPLCAVIVDSVESMSTWNWKRLANELGIRRLK